MHCPYCEQLIPNIPGYLYICPFCHTPLTDRLKERLVPPTDKAGAPVQKYSRTEQYIKQIGMINHIGYEDRVKAKIKSAKSAKRSALITAIVCALILLCSIITELFGSLIVLSIYVLIRSLIQMAKKKPLQNLQMEALFDDCGNKTIPIAFYGNDDVFGYAAVYEDCNAYDEPPQVLRHEYRKSDIYEIDEIHGEQVRVNFYDTHGRFQKFIIPAFCDIEDLKQILGINENKEVIPAPKQEPSSIRHY